MNTTLPEVAVKAAAQCYLDRTVSINETASSLAHAMLTAALPFLPVQGAVKKLEWTKGVVDIAQPMPGMKYVACSTTPKGSWAWWLDNAPETRGVFTSEAAAKAAAQADYAARILSALEPSAARELALEEAARVCDAKIVSMQSHYDQTNNPFIRSNLAGDIALISHLASSIRALSSPNHDDAGKVEGEGWSMSPPKFHRYPYFVENISGKWCLCKHHGNGASHTISVHETAREARDAAPSEGA